MVAHGKKIGWPSLTASKVSGVGQAGEGGSLAAFTLGRGCALPTLVGREKCVDWPLEFP